MNVAINRFQQLTATERVKNEREKEYDRKIIISIYCLEFNIFGCFTE